MTKSMLTYQTLDRFEEQVDPATLTPEQIKEIEHCAYCANMGAESKEAAWKWFVRLVNKYAGVNLSE